MNSRSEGTNAQNIANFKDLIELINSISTNYKPSNTDIYPDALHERRITLLILEKNVKELQTNLSHAIDLQQIEYDDINAIAMSVENEFRSSGASAKAIETLLSVTRKLKGKRSSKPKPPEEGKSEKQENISVSQLSYANRASNFEAMLLAVQAETKYNPNDASISVIGLTKKHRELIKSYESVTTIDAELTKARLMRNEALYHPETGLIKAISLVKAHIKSRYPLRSPFYRQIAGIKFRARKLK